MNAADCVMSADSLVGNDVKNNNNEDLGDIKDFMIDCQSGKVAYAVLSFGGVFGIGEKLFAVPMSALTLDTDDECFRLNRAKEELKNAPGFDSDNWPNMADRTWGEGIHNYYGSTPYWS
jgi:sporulation protein YlmC with PRC-barrel domain